MSEAQVAADAPQTEAAPVETSNTLMGGATDKPEAGTADPATTTEGQAEKPEGEGETAGDKPDADKPITPEGYGDFTIPEGMVVDEAKLGEFKTIAAELKLDKDQAQKLVDLHVQSQQAIVAQWEAKGQEWVQAVKADKEVGGDKLTESASMVAKFLDANNDLGLREMFAPGGELGWLGNHPVLFKALARAGRHYAEDRPVNTRAPVVGEKSLAELMYPSMSK